MLETPPGEQYLGLHLVVGFILALICGILFKLIADEVLETPQIRKADAYAQNSARDLNSPKLTSFMRAVTFVGNPTSVVCLTIVAGLIVYRRRSRRQFYGFAAIMLGGGLLNVLLKDVFHRARPDAFAPLIGAHGYSFPSGHAMGSTLFFGALAYIFLITKKKNPVLSVVGLLFCILAVVLICASRVYLGVHYLSDVGAGVVAGLGWIGVVVSGNEAWLRWRARRQPR